MACAAEAAVVMTGIMLGCNTDQVVEGSADHVDEQSCATVCRDSRAPESRLADASYSHLGDCLLDSGI